MNNTDETMPEKRLQSIRLLLLDVDGVLTDGAIAYTEDRTETKVFNVKDGLGIRMLSQNGIETGIVTGRASSALLRRSRELGIGRVYDNVGDKGAVFETILAETGCEAAAIAFMGDDLPDLALFGKVGVSIAVADAHEAVRDRADMITAAAGGRGAVREVCDQILKARGLWEGQLQKWM